MLRRVALVRTDVSEERSASFIRVTRIGELGTTLAVTNNRHTLRRNTIVISSQRATRRNIPEDTILQENLQLEKQMFWSKFEPNTSLIQTKSSRHINVSLS
jgi:hypothetical protein